jgi:hypothetical protein
MRSIEINRVSMQVDFVACATNTTHASPLPAGGSR